MQPSRVALAQPAEEVAPAAPEAPVAAPTDAETEAYAGMSLEELLSLQVVMSASRRAQSMHEAPSSVSLLTFEDIESMRGLNVAQPFGANATGGVISLRTRRPIDHPGLEGRVRAGLTFASDEDEDPADENLLATTGIGHVAYNYANDDRTFGMRFSLGARNVPDTATLIMDPPTHGQLGYYALVGVEARPSSDVSIYGTVSHSQIEYIDPTLASYLRSSSLVSEDAVNVNYERASTSRRRRSSSPTRIRASTSPTSTR